MIRRGNINDVALLQHIGRKTFDDSFGNTCTKEDMRGVLDLFFNSAQVALELQDDADNFFFFRRRWNRERLFAYYCKTCLPVRFISKPKKYRACSIVYIKGISWYWCRE